MDGIGRNWRFKLALAVFVVVASVLAVYYLMNFRGNQDVAVAAAREHAAQLGWKVKGISCQPYDTDKVGEKDGYIDCVVSLDEPGCSQEKQLLCDAGRPFQLYKAGCMTKIITISGS